MALKKTALHKSKFSLPILLLLLIVGVYANSLSGNFLSDDTGLIQNGNMILSIWFLFHSFPLVIPQFFHALNYFLFDLNPTLFRLTNLIFHSGNVIMLFFIIAKLRNKKVAFGSASLYAVHPLLSEPVNWISAASYLQYSFFFLTSFYLYIQGGHPSGSERNWNKLASLFYLFALLSSVFAIPLVLIFYSYEYIFGDLKKNWRKLLSFTVLALLWVGWFALAIPARLTQTSNFAPAENLYNPLQSIPFVIGTYLKLIFWPRELTFAHVTNFSNQNSYLITYLVNIVITFAYGLFLIVTFKKDRWLFFWGSFFLISLGISLLPLRLGSTIAERYVYLPTVGIILIVVSLGDRLVSKTGTRKISYLLLAILILLLSGRTIIRNRDWKSEISLLRSALELNPNIPKAHLDIAMSYLRAENYSQAATYFEKYLETDPESLNANFYLATAFLKLNQQDMAIQKLQKVLKIEPNSYASMQLLAEIYYDQKNWDLARTYTLGEIKLNPDNSTLYLNLGKIYMQMQKWSEARNSFEKSINLNPENETAKEALKSLPI